MVPKPLLYDAHQIPGIKRLPVTGTESIMPCRVQTPVGIEPVGHVQVYMVLLVVVGLIVIVLGIAVGVEKGTRSVLAPVDLNLLSRQTVPCQIRLLFAAEGEQVNRRLAVLPP